MVAVAGRGWRLAPSLIYFVDECDARFPGRSTKSDGSIGDQSHAARTSDHNPDDDEADRDPTRWVTAVDVTKDRSVGLRPFAIFDDLRVRRDPRADYCIAERQAWYSYATSAHPAFEWVRYRGDNDHEKHGHLSAKNTAAARNDMRSWFRQEDVDVALTEQDKRWLQATMRSESNAAVIEVLRAPEFDLDETSEELDDLGEAATGIAAALAMNRRMSRAALVAALVSLGRTEDQATAEAKRIETTPNAELVVPA